MSPDKQRIAIAEVCGWKVTPPGWWSHPTLPDNGGAEPEPPDYLNDLNAMHEAEKVLDDRNRQCVRYAEELERVLARAHEKCLDPSQFGMIHATAAQRAEAFLRTLNLWTES